MKKVVLLAFVLVLSSIPMFVESIKPVEASGTIYIRADGSIDPPTANITTIGNVTYTFAGNIYDEIVVERDNIVVDGAGYTLQGTGTGTGIYLLERNNVTITNVKVKAFREGIYLWNSSNNNLSMNIITNGYIGILLGGSSNNSISGNNVRLSTRPTPDDVASGVTILYSSSYNTISGNSIENAFEGVQLQSSSNYNSVSGNDVKNNYYGIGVVDSNYNSISGNTVTSGKVGIDFERCSNNIVCRNNITENNDNGITLYPQALSNVLYKNYIVNNHRGIVLWEASYNSIYNNNFVNNTQQVYIITSGYNNLWDNGYPSGGNYWSDYNGTDFYSGPYQNVSGSDGIGDTPYVINSENRDNYPLFPPEKMRDLMIEKYKELLSDYQSLNSTCNSLQSKQEATISELNYVRNLTYIFITTTIIFVAATVYLTIRKPKAKPESKTS